MNKAIVILGAAILTGCGFLGISSETAIQSKENNTATMPTPVAVEKQKLDLADSEYDGRSIEKSDDEWKQLLTGDEFYILRQEGTEKPYSGALNGNHKHGSYYCSACGLVVFRSKTKFDSGTGWPSFYQPAFKKNVVEKEDRSLGDVRIEVECARCGSHLGHVFDDGPRPTGLRYCINSAALKFQASK